VLALRNSIILLLVCAIFLTTAGSTAVYAQSDVGSWTTPAALVVITLFVVFVVAAKLRWLQISLVREPVSSGLALQNELAARGTEKPWSSLDILSECKSELTAAVESMARERQKLVEHRSWVAQNRVTTDSEGQLSLNALKQLADTSKERSEYLASEFARLKELHSTAQQEIERLREELKVSNAELESVRGKVSRDYSDLRLVRAELDKERTGVEDALHEIAKEWELINLRREEMERARMDLIENLTSVSKARDEMVHELEETIFEWGSNN
jgi:chromosome segregation ATPase